MKWLNQVAKYHEEYLEIVKNLGEKSYAEDIVQEFYLRLIKYGKEEKIINAKGILNKAYLYFCLKNTYLLFWKEKRKFKKVNLDDVKNIGVKYDYISKMEATIILEAKIDKEMKNWEWFDARLFKLYRDEGISMRDLSKKTKISTKTIFYTIKRCKDKLRKNVAEDYEDYINEDYEKI